ncbi:MAG: AAA family ATPase, partial [Deferribacteraceae bacterium]|nr:AAA family ATPase [Deferribacteraceae bacterium]
MANYPIPIGHQRTREVVERSLVNLSHAYLFSGIEGIGKKLFAIWIAKYLLCEKGSPLFTECSCSACVQADNNLHPDIHILSGNRDDKTVESKKKGNIKGDYVVDNVRTLTEIVDSTPYSGKWKVIILDGAHQLSFGGQSASANAILKTLEEPGANSVFFLITHRTDLILPTILSRCQTVYFNPLSIDELEKICRLNAIAYTQDSLAAAGGSLSNLKFLAKFNIKGFFKLVENRENEALAEIIFSFA